MVGPQLGERLVRCAGLGCQWVVSVTACQAGVFPLVGC